MLDGELKFIEARENELRLQLQEIEEKLVENQHTLNTEISISRIMNARKEIQELKQESKIVEEFLDELAENKKILMNE